MKAMGSGVLHLKLSGFCHQRTNNSPELSCHRIRAFTFNVTPTFHCLWEYSQRSKKPLEIVAVSHSADSSDNFTIASLHKPVKKRHLNGKTFFSHEAYVLDGEVTRVSSVVAQQRVGVLLLNLGGPETLHDVQPFLFNLFADPVCDTT